MDVAWDGVEKTSRREGIIARHALSPMGTGFV